MVSSAGSNNMRAQHLVTFFSVGLSAALASQDHACKLTDQYVKQEALSYVKDHYSAGLVNTKLQTRITIKENGVWTVVVSPLPVTPDASFLLRVRCTEPKVEDLSKDAH